MNTGDWLIFALTVVAAAIISGHGVVSRCAVIPLTNTNSGGQSYPDDYDRERLNRPVPAATPNRSGALNF